MSIDITVKIPQIPKKKAKTEKKKVREVVILWEAGIGK